ncbi:MAG: hypothetical protein M1812_005720 [Candelaria pacifica]|nr:MAG: hypothetical protein M1812_005720 [Candelaria pacifica]
MSAPTFYHEQTIEQAWEVSRQCLVGGSPFIVIPVSLQDALGPEGIKIIAQRYSALVRAPVEVSQTESIEAITMRVQTSDQIGQTDKDAPNPIKTPQTASEKVRDRRRIKSPTKIPKPPNAFILYRQHHHPLVKVSNPSLHNNQISIILGDQWTNESDATKTHFFAKADEMKQRHSDFYSGLHQRSRPSPERRSRKAHSRAGSSAGAARSLLDEDSLKSSPTLSYSNPPVCSSASNAEDPRNRVEAPVVSDEYFGADPTLDTFATENEISDSPEAEPSAPNEPLDIGDYIGDEEFARMMSQELRKEY